MDGGIRERLSALSEGFGKVTKRVGKLSDKEDEAAGGVAGLGGSLASLGSAVGAPALNIAGTIAQAVANVAMAYSTMIASPGFTVTPWGWIAFAAAGLAQMTAIIGSIKNATAMAEGGVVSGATYALVGEYAGASHNRGGRGTFEQAARHDSRCGGRRHGRRHHTPRDRGAQARGRPQ